VGILNVGLADSTVVMRLYGASGSQVGTTKTQAIGPGRYWQEDDAFVKWGAGQQEIAYATVEVTTTGGTVWAYGSVIDAATGDPTTVPVQRDEVTAASAPLIVDHKANAIVLDKRPEVVGSAALPAGTFTLAVSGTGNLGRTDLPTSVTCLYKYATGEMRAAALRYGESVSGVAGGNPLRCVIPDWLNKDDNTASARVTLTGAGQTLNYDLDGKTNCIVLDAQPEAVVRATPLARYALASTGNLGTDKLIPWVLVLYKDASTGNLTARALKGGQQVDGVRSDGKLVALVLEWINKDDNSGATTLSPVI
jgi:hypothetical protein